MQQLIAHARQLSQAQAALVAGLVAVAGVTPVAEFVSVEVCAALTWTRQYANSQLALAHDLMRRLPEVHAAMARGEIDLRKAQVFSDLLAGLDERLARLVAAQLLPVAGSLTTGQLRYRLARLAIAADPEAAAHRDNTRDKERRVVMQPTGDSRASLMGLDLPAHAAAEAASRLTAIARKLKQAGDPRTLDQIRADTFLHLLQGGASPVRGGVELVCDIETLAQLAANPGHLNGYGPVIADIARQIAERQRHTPWSFTIRDNDGQIHTGITRRRPRPHRPPPGRAARQVAPTGSSPRRAPCDPSSSGAASSDTAAPAGGFREHGMGGKPLLDPRFGDPRRRSPNAALTRQIRARDRTCRAPGCRRPATHADIDHTIAYEDGGLTTPGNLGVLCRFHHRAKHRGGWKLEQIEPGVFIWRSPLGQIYLITPEDP